MKICVSILFFLTLQVVNAQSVKTSRWLIRQNIKTISFDGYRSREMQFYTFDTLGKISKYHTIDTVSNTITSEVLYERGKITIGMTQNYQEGRILDSTFAYYQYDENFNRCINSSEESYWLESSRDSILTLEYAEYFEGSYSDSILKMTFTSLDDVSIEESLTSLIYLDSLGKKDVIVQIDNKKGDTTQVNYNPSLLPYPRHTYTYQYLEFKSLGADPGISFPQFIKYVKKNKKRVIIESY
jgi:hypothetical protein